MVNKLREWNWKKEHVSLVAGNHDAVKIIALAKKYGSDKTAVHDLSFSLRRGEILGLVGPNGAGKTTTLKCIIGLVRPTAGNIWVEGNPAGSREARAAIAYIPETPLLYDDLTVTEHLKFVAMAYRVPQKRAIQRIDQLLRDFELEEEKDETPLAFSRGMRRKLSVVCALVHDAPVLLVDEPFTGLDPHAVWTLKKWLRRARAEGRSVLLSTHMLGIAEELCDRFLILHQGRKIAEGTLAELRELPKLSGRTEASLEEVFISLTNPNPEFGESKME
ncbi:MAG: ABC transporter ATP-binding protein [Candidatus Diapherotrites archaeon]|nr:ABC transporter ATP-binding protein [Candidatus Diapherotrites archaeon]